MAISKSLIIFALFMLISFALYGNILKGEFVYDDYLYKERQELRDPRYLPNLFREPYTLDRQLGIYRPLTIISFALNFILFGQSPASFHLTSILLNGVAVFLAFLLVHQLFKDFKLAFISAVIYAFLPIHTEAVAFIKARDEFLSTILGLTSWLFFHKGVFSSEKKNRSLAASSIFYFFGLLTKEMAIVFWPLFMAVWWFQAKPTWKKMVVVSSWYAVPLGIYLAARFLVLGEYSFKDNAHFIINPLKYVAWPERIFTALHVLLIYVTKTIIPYKLSATYHFRAIPIGLSWATGVGFGLLALILGAIWQARKKASAWQIGLVMFFVSYLIFSQLLLVGGEIASERWLYFPSLGLAIITGYLFLKLIERSKKIGITLLAILLIVYGGIVVRRNRVWTNLFTLYTSMVEDAPESVQGHLSLGRELVRVGKLAEGRQHLERALAIYRNFPPAIEMMGIVLAREGNYSEAEKWLLESISLDSRRIEAHTNLGKLYFDQGRYLEALNQYGQVLKLTDQPTVWHVLDYAYTLSKMKFFARSTEMIFKYIPPHLHTLNELRFILAVNYYRMGKIDEARKYFDWNMSLSEEEKTRVLETF